MNKLPLSTNTRSVRCFGINRLF